MKNKTLQKLPCNLVVACPPMKNNDNISMIVRAASCFGASKVIITGQNRVNPPISRDCPIEIEYRNSILAVVNTYKAIGYTMIGLEQNEYSFCLSDLNYFTDRVFLVVGNETKGMDKEILDLMDMVVEIPLVGEPFSLNVAMAASICLCHLATIKQPVSGV